MSDWVALFSNLLKMIVLGSLVSESVTFGLHSYADTLDCIVSFLTLPTPKPMYDTISRFSCVRYDLESGLHAIRSLSSFLYDINLGATATTILRIRGVQVLIDLVSSATDSYRRSIVLFKPMSVPTSDPKSEFLYQSSNIAQNIQTPLNHLVRLGYLSHPRHHVSPVLSQSECSH